MTYQYEEFAPTNDPTTEGLVPGVGRIETQMTNALSPQEKKIQSACGAAAEAFVSRLLYPYPGSDQIPPGYMDKVKAVFQNAGQHPTGRAMNQLENFREQIIANGWEQEMVDSLIDSCKSKLGIKK